MRFGCTLQIARSNPKSFRTTHASHNCDKNPTISSCCAALDRVARSPVFSSSLAPIYIRYMHTIQNTHTQLYAVLVYIAYPYRIDIHLPIVRIRCDSMRTNLLGHLCCACYWLQMGNQKFAQYLARSLSLSVDVQMQWFGIAIFLWRRGQHAAFQLAP